MTYRIVLSRQAKRYFASVPKSIAVRLAAVFQLLEQNSHPVGARQLKGDLEGLSRMRVGNLRIVYEVLENSQEIHVLRIGPRGDVY